VRFVKGHGTGNDFVVLVDPERRLDLTPELVRRICHRRRGLGGDGVLRAVLAATDPEGATMSDAARWFMDYRNADGSVAEMCGNGIRVFARFLVDSWFEPAGELPIATRAGIKMTRLDPVGDVTVDLGPARLPRFDHAIGAMGRRRCPATAVAMPNPHAVAFVDDLADVGDLAVAPVVAPATAFPDGVNVEFVVVAGPGQAAMRVHERGVGETDSCGTGAAAAIVAARRRHGPSTPATWQLDVRGGTLLVTERSDHAVELTGPAVLVAEGELSESWLAAEDKDEGILLN
jgi:diaminopimelate epimerase